MQILRVFCKVRNLREGEKKFLEARAYSVPWVGSARPNSCYFTFNQNFTAQIEKE